MEEAWLARSQTQLENARHRKETCWGRGSRGMGSAGSSVTKDKSPQLPVSLSLARGIPPEPSKESLEQGAGLPFWPPVCVFVELTPPAHSPCALPKFGRGKPHPEEGAGKAVSLFWRRQGVAELHYPERQGHPCA